MLPALTITFALLQIRSSGRHHGIGLLEPRALRDNRRKGSLGEGVEDSRGISAGVSRPRVSQSAPLPHATTCNHEEEKMDIRKIKGP